MSETSTAIAVQEKPSALQVLLADPDRLKDFPVATVERLYTLHKDMQADQAKPRVLASVQPRPEGHGAGSQAGQ